MGHREISNLNSNRLSMEHSPNRNYTRKLSTGTFTRLMRASAFGNLELVKELLSEGAEINEKGPRGSTALMFAASGGFLEIVQELVENGAEVEAKEEGGWTALRHAQEDGHLLVADYLCGVLIQD